MNKKVIAIILIIAIVLNLALLISGMISQSLFWIAAIAIAIIAYKVVPKLNNQ